MEECPSISETILEFTFLVRSRVAHVWRRSWNLISVNPVQAIVAAFELDERTVARWQRESGAQCKRVHEHLIEAGRVALLQVQADELRISRGSVRFTGWHLPWR
jgi:hypothetical protein